VRNGIDAFIESAPHVKGVLEPEFAQTVGLVATGIDEALNCLAIARKVKREERTYSRKEARGL